MIERTQAIVLRTAPVSNTSRAVIWLSESGARITTLIKGALRPKSFFLGQFDLFYTCELLYYMRERRGLHPVRECYPLNMRTRLRSDWQAAAAASWLADLSGQVSFSDTPHSGLFKLLEQGLDHLEARGAAPELLFWFEIRLLTLLGWAPRLDLCAGCQADLHAVRTNVRWSAPSGGLLCARCAASTTADRTVEPGTLAVLTDWQRAATPMRAGRTRCSMRQLGDIRDVLGGFLQWHLEAGLAGRSIALDLLGEAAASA